MRNLLFILMLIASTTLRAQFGSNTFGGQLDPNQVVGGRYANQVAGYSSKGKLQGGGILDSVIAQTLGLDTTLSGLQLAAFTQQGHLVPHGPIAGPGWLLSGNSGLSYPGNFLGSTDGSPVVIANPLDSGLMEFASFGKPGKGIVLSANNVFLGSYTGVKIAKFASGDTSFNVQHLFTYDDGSGKENLVLSTTDQNGTAHWKVNTPAFDSATIYSFVSPLVGQTYYCTNCTGNQPNQFTGGLVSWTGSLWRRNF